MVRDRNAWETAPSRVRRFDKVLGLVFLVLGILGYVDALTPNGLLFGLFMVDPVHNIVHLVTGVILLIAGFGHSESFARNTTLVVAVAYAVVTILGFLPGNTILGLFMVNMADNLLHLVVTLAAFAVALPRQAAGPVQR